MKIKKLQGGGFATFTPILPSMPTPNIKPESKTDSDSGSLVDKDIYKKLIEAGGLVNDVNAFVEAVQKMESSSPYPYLSGSNRMSAVGMIGTVNELIQSKKYWEESLKNAKESGGLGEVAVDGYKRMYVRDSDNNVKAITIDEYKKAKNKPQLMTVGDLLNARQYDPKFVGNKSIFNIANESIGIDTVRDDIRDMMTLLSEASISSEKHYSKQQIMSRLRGLAGQAPTEDVLRGIQELSEIAETPGDFYKVISENKGKRKNINTALTYIWKTLSRPAQNKIEAVSAINGSDPTKLIYDMLYTYTEPSITQKIIPEKETDVYGTSTDKTRKPLTVFQLIQKDKLATANSSFAFNDPKLGVLFRGAIGGVSQVITPDGEPVGMQTLNNVFNNAKIGYGLFLQQDQAMVGNKKLTENELNQVVYDGKDAAKVYMPVDGNGNPDYQRFVDFKEIYAEYNDNKEYWTAEEATNFFKSNGYNLVVDEAYDGTKMEKIIRDNSYVKPFYVMYGYTNDATDIINKENSMFQTRLSKKEEDEVVPFLKQIWTIGSGKKTKDMTPDDWFGEDYYKVMVTVPYKQGYAAIVDAMVGQGPQESAVMMEQVSANLKGSTQKPTGNMSADVLN